MDRVHLDYNATTPLRPEARTAFLEVLDAGLGNASSVHGSGRAARAVVDDARERIAGALGIFEDDLIFTSGGTESNNLALFGAAQAMASAPERLITTPVEHAAVLQPAAELCERVRPELELVHLTVNEVGFPDLDQLSSEVSRGPAIVSIIAANNEIGTVVPFEAVRSAIGHAPDILYHSDAVQLLGKRRFRLDDVDLASFSAHKVGGPVGVGLLVRKPGVGLQAQIFGGAQEAALRPGTENVAAIAGAARAIELAVEEVDAFESHTRRLTRRLWENLQSAVAGMVINGLPIDAKDRLPNTLNLSAPLQEARTLVVRLDLEGLEVSAGSACTSGSIEASHVLSALGIEPARAAAGLRLSVGRTTTEEDIHSAVEKLRTTLGKES